MAFIRKSLQEIYEDLSSKHNSTLSRYPNRRDLFESLLKTLAGASHGWYGYAENILKQCFTTTADIEGLERQGADFGIFRKEATHASGTVKFTYSNQVIDVPIGTILTTDKGVQYQITSQTTDDGTAQVKSISTGVAANADAGIEMSLTPAISGVINAVAIEKGIVGGVDIESVEDYRSRILFRKQNPPGCGTVADYIFWATSIEGVTRAWVQRNTPLDGQITVRIMTDNLTNDGFPSELKVEEVQAYIDSMSPTEATVFVGSPIKKTLDITISNLEQNSLDIQNRIKARLQEFLKKEATIGGQVVKNKLIATIATTPGLIYFTLDTPVDDVSSEAAELIVLGEVTFL